MSKEDMKELRKLLKLWLEVDNGPDNEWTRKIVEVIQYMIDELYIQIKNY